MRVVRPGGQIVIVDYHRPRLTHLLYWPMLAVFRILEPYALTFWQEDICTSFPWEARGCAVRKTTSMGGLYQLLSVTR